MFSNYFPVEIQDTDNQTFEFIKVSKKDKTLILQLARPQKKNALSPQMVNEIAFAIQYAQQSPSIWNLILKAEGSVFCAGADLKAFAGASEESISSIPQPQREVLMGELFKNLSKPSIAIVHADAMAGAMLLLCGCTYVVAADTVRFHLPEVKRGLFPFQVLASLMDVMPHRRALDWCIRGNAISAQEALSYGLATHVTDLTELEATAEQIIEELSQNSPSAIASGLETYIHLQKNGTSNQHPYLMQQLMECLGTPNAQEGLQAFMEKRMPVWR